MTTGTTWPLLTLDLCGVFVFGLSGGLAAVREQFDVLSVLMFAAAAGLGGGVLRDVLIDAAPPVGVSDWRLRRTATSAGRARCGPAVARSAARSDTARTDASAPRPGARLRREGALGEPARSDRVRLLGCRA